MNRAERQAARLALGAAAVLTEATAVELLPFGDARARAWLRDHRLVHEDPDLGRYVIWSEVLSELARPAADRPSPARKLPRERLGR